MVKKKYPVANSILKGLNVAVSAALGAVVYTNVAKRADPSIAFVPAAYVTAFSIDSGFKIIDNALPPYFIEEKAVDLNEEEFCVE